VRYRASSSDSETTTPTTDPQDEELEVLDSGGRPSGRRKRRADVHRDGDWHLALHIWVGCVAAEGELVLLQRRSLTKDTWPGSLDVAVAGHVRAGETPAQAVREAEEEIGLVIGFEELTRIGRRHLVEPPERELQDVFAIRRDAPLASYRLHPEEVDGIVVATIDDALRVFRGDALRAPARERLRATGETREIELSVASFAGRPGDRYPVTALEQLRAVLRGDPVVPFETRSG
jgi:isopentenyldiphosphate isomerase